VCRQQRTSRTIARETEGDPGEEMVQTKQKEGRGIFAADPGQASRRNRQVCVRRERKKMQRKKTDTERGEERGEVLIMPKRERAVYVRNDANQNRE